MTRQPTWSSLSRNRQSGFVLIVALVLLLILTIIGLAATQSTNLEERMAGNERDHDMAFQAAEAALRSAEGGTEEALWNNWPSDSNGQYLFVPTTPPQWQTAGWLSTPGNVLNYQTVTGNTLPGVAQQPVFMIEQMPPVPAPGQSLGLQQFSSGVPQIQVYRITAQGWGGDANAQVMLQSVYRP